MVLFTNRFVLGALSAWFLAQALKIPTYWLIEKKINWKRFFGSGGMPSSHSASVVCLTTMIGMTQGFDTPLFALSLMFASIVMYDATGVRRETGRQGKVINEILEAVLIDGKPISDDDLKELVGHTPFEVLGGVVVGFFCAAMWLYLIPVF